MRTIFEIRTKCANRNRDYCQVSITIHIIGQHWDGKEDWPSRITVKICWRRRGGEGINEKNDVSIIIVRVTEHGEALASIDPCGDEHSHGVPSSYPVSIILSDECRAVLHMAWVSSLHGRRS